MNEWLPVFLWLGVSVVTFYSWPIGDMINRSPRFVFWCCLGAPVIGLFFIGWGIARLLGYLFYLRKSL